MQDERPIDDLAAAVLDGGDIDWVRAESEADASDSLVIRHLRVLATIAGVHRDDAPDGPTPGPEGIGPPETWGHLRILEPVGRGAFGEVYRAWDTRLDREVALKLLPAMPRGGGKPGSPVIQEGRLLARVRHPHVVTIHGADEIGGRVGLWMELVRGRTLEALLAEDVAFGPAEVARIGADLAGAVEAVHAAGLVHGDIKAQNAMRDADGRIVLMDFGAGRDVADDRAGLSGTPLYLAPEVLAGGRASTGSDVYSLGVLLYHLLTRTFPVMGSTVAELVRSHEQGTRTSLRARRPDLASALTRVIDRAIDPRPERRYETARAFGAALETLTRRPLRRLIVPIAAAAAVILAAALYAWPDRPPVVTVLPVENLGTEEGSDLVAEGLGHEIVSHLAQIDGLVVRNTPSSPSPDARRDVMAADVRSGSDFVLETSLLVRPWEFKLNAKLVRTEDQVAIWARTFTRSDVDVLAALDDMALEVVNRLRLEVGSGQRRYQTDPELELLFLRARALQVRRRTAFAKQAAALFESIVERDRGYAPAVAGLARSLGDIWRLNEERDPGGVDPRLEQAVLEAMRLDPMLADTQAALGLLYTRDRRWTEAEAAFRRAIAIDPGQGYLYTDFVLALLLPLARLDDAIEVLETARSVDPFSLDVRRVLALVQIESGRYEGAIENSRWVLERDPAFPFADLWLGRALYLSGRADEALQIFEGRPGQWPHLGYLYAVTGRRAEAEALAATHPEAPIRQMLIYGGLGDKERAFEALERAAELNAWRAATWMIRPEVAILRDDPRYLEMRRRLGLPE